MVSCTSAVVLSRILCQCGLDVSAMDFDGWTPLHAAAHWGQGEACRVLAEHLCNMEARSNAVRPRNNENTSITSYFYVQFFNLQEEHLSQHLDRIWYYAAGTLYCKSNITCFSVCFQFQVSFLPCCYFVGSDTV